MGSSQHLGWDVSSRKGSCSWRSHEPCSHHSPLPPVLMVLPARHTPSGHSHPALLSRVVLPARYPWFRTSGCPLPGCPMCGHALPSRLSGGFAAMHSAAVQTRVPVSVLQLSLVTYWHGSELLAQLWLQAPRSCQACPEPLHTVLFCHGA